MNHTCQNGGSCNDGVNNYSCNCLSGFTGDRCETGTYFPLFLFSLLFSLRHTLLFAFMTVKRVLRKCKIGRCALYVLFSL